MFYHILPASPVEVWIARVRHGLSLPNACEAVRQEDWRQRLQLEVKRWGSTRRTVKSVNGLGPSVGAVKRTDCCCE